MKRLLLWVFLVALGIGALMLLLFALRIALVLVFVALLCLGAAGLMGWLSLKRLRSTRATRHDTTSPTTT
jgi:hypothetical protein